MPQRRIEGAALLCDANRGAEKGWLGKIRRHLPGKRWGVHDVANLAGARRLEALVVMPKSRARQREKYRDRQARHRAPARIIAK